MILASPKEGKDKALDAEKRRLIKCWKSEYLKYPLLSEL